MSSSDLLTLRVLIPRDLVGAVIGKAGNYIQSVREKSGAKVILEAGEGSPGDAWFAVTGARPNVVSAVIGLAEKTAESAPFCLRLFVAQSQVGPLIGKGGSTITRLRALRSSCTLTVSPLVGLDAVPERVFTAVGNLEDLAAVVPSVVDIFAENPPLVTLSAALASEMLAAAERGHRSQQQHQGGRGREGKGKGKGKGRAPREKKPDAEGDSKAAAATPAEGAPEAQAQSAGEKKKEQGPADASPVKARSKQAAPKRQGSGGAKSAPRAPPSGWMQPNWIAQLLPAYVSSGRRPSKTGRRTSSAAGAGEEQAAGKKKAADKAEAGAAASDAAAPATAPAAAPASSGAAAANDIAAPSDDKVAKEAADAANGAATPKSRNRKGSQHGSPAQQPKDVVTQEFCLLSEYVSALIGRGGSNIKEIRKNSGAEVRIYGYIPPASRVLSIMGTPQSIRTAIDLITNRLHDHLKSKAEKGKNTVVAQEPEQK